VDLGCPISRAFCAREVGIFVDQAKGWPAGTPPPRVNQKQKCGPGPATPSRICFVGSRSAFVTARRRNDRFGPTALASRRVASATFAKAGYRSARPCESRIRNRCGGQRSGPAHEEQEGRRPLCPGNQPRLRACPDVPRQFTLENHRLTLASPQSFSEFGNAHVFAAQHSALSHRRLQLENIRSLCTNCGRCDFPVESRGKLRRESRPRGFTT